MDSTVTSTHALDPLPSDISNGEVHRHLPIAVDPVESSIGIPAAEPAGSVAANQDLAQSSDDSLAAEFESSRVANQDLEESCTPDLAADVEGDLAVDANQELAEEVASLRDALSEKEQTRVLLEKQLSENREKAEALSEAIASMGLENREHADTGSALAQEFRDLHAEKVDLLDQNARIALENESLDATYAEMKTKLSSLSNAVEGKKAAMAAAQARVLMVCFEIERLQREKEEYSKEVSTIGASNDSTNAQVARLTEDEKALSREIQNVMASQVSREQKISDLQATIAALDDQLSPARENEKLLPNQLNEAKARLEYLEDLDNAMVLRETEMLAHIKALEDQLHTLRADSDITRQAVDQEEAKAGNSRTLEVACIQVRASERDLHAFEFSNEMQEGYTIADAVRQQAQSIDGEVADMCAETQVLACSNENLKTNSMEQQENEMVASTQLREDIRKLQDSLNEAEEKAQVLRGKEAELKWKLQELTISMGKEPRLGSLATPLVISGGTIVLVGLLVFLWHSKSKSK